MSSGSGGNNEGCRQSGGFLAIVRNRQLNLVSGSRRGFHIAAGILLAGDSTASHDPKRLRANLVDPITYRSSNPLDVLEAKIAAMHNDVSRPLHSRNDLLDPV